MTLRKLTVKRFQGHKSTVVEFDPKRTVIVGPTDAGKTSILRALRLLFLNPPKGSSFVQDGKSSLVVKAVVDGHTIIRKIGKENAYYLDGKKFKAFGSGKVPPEIEQLLNVDEINFQSQLDAPFWFTETPGQVSKNLNEIVNLEIIDKSVGKIATEVRASKNSLEVCNERIKEAKAAVKELKWVKEFKRDALELQDLQTKASETADTSRRIASHIESVETLSRKTSSLSQAILEAKEITDLADKLVKQRKDRRKLQEVIQELEKQTLLVNVEIPDTSELLTIRKKGDQIAERRRNLEMLVDELEAQEKDLWLVQLNLDKLEKKVKNTKVCPVCGQSLPKTRSVSSTSPMYTSHSKHQSHGPKKKTGLKSLPGI
jgi:exonuclease SbcC